MEAVSASEAPKLVVLGNIHIDKFEVEYFIYQVNLGLRGHRDCLEAAMASNVKYNMPMSIRVFKGSDFNFELKFDLSGHEDLL